MKIAFAGKGGSGKTTLSSLFVRYLAAQGLPVVAIDADINQHLAEALGAAEPPPLGAHLTQIKEYLRGTNPRISSAAAMVKTTPPGRGSRLLRHGGPDPVHDLGVDTPCGARLLATGPFDEDDLGVACYHSKTGAVELYLNHLVDGPGEYVVVDCTAGADSFASGLFTRFDLTVLVAEPTRKGISVYRQWQGYCRRLRRRPRRRREQGAGHLRTWRSCASTPPATCWPGSATSQRSGPWNRAARSAWTTSAPRPWTALGALQDRLDAQPRDWARYTRQAAEFHRQERPRLGQRRRRRGPGGPDRPGIHPRAARAYPGDDMTFRYCADLIEAATARPGPESGTGLRAPPGPSAGSAPSALSMRRP